MTFVRRSLPTLLAAAAVLLASPALGAAGAPLERYFTADELARHEAYMWPLRLDFVLGELLSLVFALAFLLFGFNRRLLVRCTGAAGRLSAPLSRVPGLRRVSSALTLMWGDAGWGGALLFALAYLGLAALVSLPLDFAFDWLYERRHGTSVQPLWHWLWDLLKAQTFEALALSALVFGLYGLARRLRRWWLWLGVPSAALLLVGGVLDPYRVQLFRDYLPLPDGEVRARITEVLTKAGVEYEDVYALKMNQVTRRVNAFIAGQGPSRRIVLYDTLLAAMTPAEIGNAVAHELGHLEDRHLGRVVLASACVVPLLFAMAWTLRRLGRTRRFGFEDDRDVASLPAALLLVWLVQSVATPVSVAYGRALERRADAYALELLQDPAAYRSMLVKLGRINLSDLRSPAWLYYWASSHPRELERIEQAERFAQARGIPLAPPSPELFAVPEQLLPSALRADAP